VIDKVVECKGKRAGDDLVRKNHWQQKAVVVLGFVASHGCDLFGMRTANGVPEMVFTASTWS
jgi:hypothetical protein